MRRVGNIRTRLATLVIAMLAGCLAIGLLGISSLRSTVAGLDSVYLDRVVPLRDLKTISDLYAVNIVDASHKSLSGEMAPAEAATLMTESKEQIGRLWSSYLATKLIDDEKRIIARIEPLMRAAEQPLRSLVRSLERNQSAEVADFVDNQLYELIDPLSGAFHDLIEVQLDVSKQEYEAGLARYEQSVRLTFGLVLLVALIGGGFAFATVRSITRPLDELRDASARVASGDLTQDLILNGRDEITDVQQSLIHMQANLRETLTDIHGSATQLAAAAEELTAVTEHSAQTIQQQDGQVQLAATAVTEMSAAVDEVARTAVDTSAASSSAASLTSGSRTQVSNTRHTIDLLGDKLGETETTVARLIEETNRIVQVLDVIQAIAGQTNLLALNAAIEAARAGEAGRGFAVVADEVRSLAQRTQASTAEIERMIGSIQQASEEAAEHMRESSDFARRTQEMAGLADGSLGQVSDQVAHINDMNLVIASAAEEQAQVARSVDQNLIAIGDLSRQSAASAEQTSAASEALAQLAVQLNNRVGQFRL